MITKISLRVLDVLFSIFGIVLLFPIFIMVILAIPFNSKGPVFFFQSRVGKNNKDFKLIKFRTMHVKSDVLGLITVGGRDPRITSLGYYLRKYKLDELPQLFNVLLGHMSLVGPRPEVRKYVYLYSKEQMHILTVLPGITDYASVEYANENELLAQQANPEEYYIHHIMPHKIQLNMKYIQNYSVKEYFKIIFLTIYKIVKG